MDFATIFCLQSKVVILASNLQPGGPELVIYFIIFFYPRTYEQFWAAFKQSRILLHSQIAQRDPGVLLN
jgi:hypothetical protein